MWTFFRWPGRDLARRNLVHLGQCTLARVAWAEPGLPTSGRDMWDLAEDLRVRVLVELRVEETEELAAGSGSPATLGPMSAMVEAATASSDLQK